MAGEGDKEMVGRRDRDSEWEQLVQSLHPQAFASISYRNGERTIHMSGLMEPSLVLATLVCAHNREKKGETEGETGKGRDKETG